MTCVNNNTPATNCNEHDFNVVGGIFEELDKPINMKKIVYVVIKLNI